MLKYLQTILFLIMVSGSQAQITDIPAYTYEQTDGAYCKVPLIKWVIPTVQSIQDRFDLEDFGINLAKNRWVSVINNVSEENLSFDFYYPVESKSSLKPLIIFAHGGGFLVGGREDRSITFLCKEFAQRGYATASIEYRLKAISTFDMVEAGYMAMQDGNAAIKYFRANAVKFGIDPDKIFIAGISAGAILALHSGHYDKGEDLLGQATMLDNALGCYDCTGDHVTVSNKVAGVINIVGATTSPSILNPDLPTLHLYCPQDSVVPAMSGIPLSNYKKTGILGAIFYPILQKISRPTVYGPLYLKNNLKLSSHTYIDGGSLSNSICDHDLFMAENGVVKSSGKEALLRINDWIKDLIKPNFSFPKRNVSLNSWTTYNLSGNIVSHSFQPTNMVSYSKISNNSFKVKPKEVGNLTFNITALDDLGLSTTSTLSLNTSNSKSDAESTSINNDKSSLINYIIIAIIFVSLLAIGLILKNKIF